MAKQTCCEDAAILAVLSSSLVLVHLKKFVRDLGNETKDLNL
jgi:hypothetical protein